MAASSPRVKPLSVIAIVMERAERLRAFLFNFNDVVGCNAGIKQMLLERPNQIWPLFSGMYVI